MDKIKVRKNGIALLMLALLAGNLTMAGSAKTVPLTGAQPQQGKKPPTKVVPVPADWITIEDEAVGYSFEVPKGTKHAVEDRGDFVLIHAVLPAPFRVAVMVFVYRGKQYTKDILLKLAMETEKSLGAKTVTTGELVEADKDYNVADFKEVHPEGAHKGKVLVVTGAKNSYVMLVLTEEAKFKATEEVMDEIWGSFSIPPAGAHISELTLGKDKAMRQPTEEFTTTETIYAAVKISKNEGAVTVKGMLHVVEIAGQKAGPIPATELTLTVKGDATANFNFIKPTKGWPLGKYKFEAAITNEKGEATDVQSHEFTVQ